MRARGALSEEMNKLRRELTLMETRVEEDIGKSLAVMRSNDEELLKDVRKNGKIIDSLQIKIEDIALVLIATQQPVARDLRELITAFKITSNLERINDYGIHLVKTAKKLSGRPRFRSMDRIERMAETGQQMLKAAFSAYLEGDPGAARDAAVLDARIDDEHKAITEELLALMKEKPGLVKAAARLLKLSGYMERMGDHITAICEGVIFIVEGSHVELNQ